MLVRKHEWENTTKKASNRWEKSHFSSVMCLKSIHFLSFFWSQICITMASNFTALISIAMAPLFFYVLRFISKLLSFQKQTFSPSYVISSFHVVNCHVMLPLFLVWWKYKDCTYNEIIKFLFLDCRYIIGYYCANLLSDDWMRDFYRIEGMKSLTDRISFQFISIG